MDKERKEGYGGKQEGKTRKFREAQRQRGEGGGGGEEEREKKPEWEEQEENNKERWGGTGYATFLLTTASNQIKGKHDTSGENEGTVCSLHISFRMSNIVPFITPGIMYK